MKVNGAENFDIHMHDLAALTLPLVPLLFSALITVPVLAAYLIDWTAGRWAAAALQVGFVLVIGASVVNLTRTVLKDVHSEAGNAYQGMLIYLILFICLSIALALWVPAFGWDSLLHWMLHSSTMLSEETTQIEGYFHHPPTYSAAVALAYFPLSVASGSLVFTLWSLATIVCSCFMLFSYSGNQSTVNLLIPVIMLSVPLFENHTMIFGYADFAIGALFFSGLVFLSMWSNTQQRKYLLFSFYIFLSIMSFKLYSAIYTIVGLSIFLFLACRRVFIFVSAVTAVVFTFLFLQRDEIFVEIFGRRLGLSPDSGKLLVGWYEFPLSFPSIKDATSIYLASWFKNMSFSVLPTFILVSLAVCFDRRRVIASCEFQIFSIALCTLVAAQLFVLSTDYGIKTSLPGMDTGFSRQSIPLLMISPFLAAAYLKVINAPEDA